MRDIELISLAICKLARSHKVKEANDIYTNFMNRYYGKHKRALIYGELNNKEYEHNKAETFKRYVSLILNKD